LNAYRHADYAIALGKQGNWIEVAREMQLAAESDPGLAIYWLQTGYAYGRAAAENASYLDEATSTYKRGIELEPGYAINRANLAVLLWFAGLDNEAFDQMRIATTNAPKSYQLLANKGMIEEQIGLEDEANSSYNQAINLQPEIANSVFWQDSEIKREARQNATEHTIFVSTLVYQAREYISEQEVDSARSLLEEAYGLNDQEVSLYTAFAELSFSEGDLDKAEQYIRIALWVQATRNQAKAEAILLGAEISYAQGNNEEALRRYQIAYHAILADTSYGWGSAGWSPYAWFVFQRITFPEDLLPQLERVDIPTEIAERLLQYAVILDDHAQVKEAQAVRDHLEPYLPK
jgi:Flp pilus assembly protein TadD